MRPSSLLLSEELVNLVGSVGQEAPWQQQGQGAALTREALGLDRDAGPRQSQFSANPRAAPQCFWFSCPLPSLGQLLSPQRYRLALRRGRQEKSEGWAVAWGGWEGWRLQKNRDQGSEPTPTLTNTWSCKDTQGLWPQFFI